MTIVRARKKGQITLPKLVRERVGIEPDTPLGIAVSRGKVILEPLAIAPYPTRRYTRKQLEQFVRDDKLPLALAKKVERLLSE